MSKVANFELLPKKSYLVRVSETGWTWGMPYEIIVVVINRDNGVAEIKGLDKKPSTAHWRALFNKLKEMNFTEAFYDRYYSKGGCQRKTFKIE